MQVDIYIKEKTGTREIRIPILPEAIAYKSGEATFVSFDIINRGEVAVPTGSELSAFSWQSEFPGELRKNDPMLRGEWQTPKTYNDILESWKNNGTKLNILVLGYPINTDVYISEYTASATGAFGDLAYELKLVEARDITINKTSTTTQSTSKTTTQRAATKDESYTIKSGDTLWAIAYKFYGSGTKWGTIYNANKDIIEKTAKQHGKSSSENGHWIYPGVTLTIPSA